MGHNRRRKNHDLATAIARVMTAVLSNVMVQMQRQLNDQQSPNNSPNQGSVNHTRGSYTHREPPINNREAKGSTDPPTEETNTTTTMASTATSKRATKKQKGNQHHYANPAVSLQQIPPATQPNKKPYNGTFPYCNTCTYHHPPTSVCRFCTNCNRFGHFITNRRKTNRLGARNKGSVQLARGPVQPTCSSRQLDRSPRFGHSTLHRRCKRSIRQFISSKW